MSRRYTAAGAATPTDLVVQGRHQDMTIEQLRARLVAATARIEDLESAHAALIAEVNTLRAVLRIKEDRLALQAEQVRVGRGINALHARMLSVQSDELVRAYDALGALTRKLDPDHPAWAAAAVRAAIFPDAEDR
jgi:hypothetical protein